MLYKRVQNLLETASFDPEYLPPPKEFWFDEEQLKEWFEERKALAKELTKNEPY